MHVVWGRAGGREAAWETAGQGGGCSWEETARQRRGGEGVSAPRQRQFLTEEGVLGVGRGAGDCGHRGASYYQMARAKS